MQNNPAFPPQALSDFEDPPTPDLSYQKLLAHTVLSWPRSDDFSLTNGVPVTGLYDWDKLGPEKVFSFLKNGSAALSDDDRTTYLNASNTQPSPTASLGQAALLVSGSASQPYPELPKGAADYPLTWSDGVGRYEWDAPQVAIDHDSRVTPTGAAGGHGVLSTTNTHGVVSVDVPDPQRGQLVRTFYDAQTHQPLGSFHVVPGQENHLDDGQTTVSFGLPPSASSPDSTGFQPSAEFPTFQDLQLAQANFSSARHVADPIHLADQTIDRWAHLSRRSRVFDYMVPTETADPGETEVQMALINAAIPESREWRPGTSKDFYNALSLVPVPVDELAAALRFGEPTLEGLEAILGKAPALKFHYRTPPLGLPEGVAEAKGVPRFNPRIYAHVVGADAEERLAHVVQSIPDEQVVRWGDRIGAHGADVISVNRRTGKVTLWDAKYRGSDIGIRHSETFLERIPRPGKLSPRENAVVA